MITDQQIEEALEELIHPHQFDGRDIEKVFRIAVKWALSKLGPELEHRDRTAKYFCGLYGDQLDRTLKLMEKYEPETLDY